jgi:SulP family sulfate permease
VGLNTLAADIVTKAGPVMAIAVTTILAWQLDWPSVGLKVVGAVPQGLPPLTAPLFDVELWKDLFIPALLISIVGVFMK